MRPRNLSLALLCTLLIFGCARAPVREAVKVDLSVPVGRIEGNQFTGIRYPFNVSAPPGWTISTTAPAFMEGLGYAKEGLQASQVFIVKPQTESNLQIDFEPAGPHVTFSQPMIENLTTSVTGSITSDLKEDYGKDLRVDVAPTQPVTLKGVPFAAEKHVTYSVKGVNRQQGWIYAFVEPYQIFILYMTIEKEGSNDRQDMKKIQDSFEVVPKKP